MHSYQEEGKCITQNYEPIKKGQQGVLKSEEGTLVLKAYVKLNQIFKKNPNNLVEPEEKTRQANFNLNN